MVRQPRHPRPARHHRSRLRSWLLLLPKCVYSKSVALSKPILSKSVRTVVVPYFQNRAGDEKSEEKACSRRFLIVLLQPNQIPSWFSKRDSISSLPIPLPGEMPEWSNGPHSKCGERATVPGVRIPLSPQSGFKMTSKWSSEKPSKLA